MASYGVHAFYRNFLNHSAERSYPTVNCATFAMALRSGTTGGINMTSACIMWHAEPGREQ